MPSQIRKTAQARGIVENLIDLLVPPTQGGKKGQGTDQTPWPGVRATGTPAPVELAEQLRRPWRLWDIAYKHFVRAPHTSRNSRKTAPRTGITAFMRLAA